MMYMDFKRKLPIPMETKEMYPLTGDMAETVERTVTELKAIFSGDSEKLALIIGPCSADNEESVIDYISRLMPLREQVKDKILIVPRIYTNKPRTTGEGYKGLVHQPDPNAQPDLFKGIIATRELHMRAVKETGFVCADEMLYPENHKYLDDLLGYVAVGARSVEDQQHRLTASAIECPVGMKNPTSGDLTVMMNSILAAQHEHDFIYRGWEGHSYGSLQEMGAEESRRRGRLQPRQQRKEALRAGAHPQGSSAFLPLQPEGKEAREGLYGGELHRRRKSAGRRRRVRKEHHRRMHRVEKDGETDLRYGGTTVIYALIALK